MNTKIKNVTIDEPRVWKAAIYCRLSKEDGDKVEGNKFESDSITSQRHLLREYVDTMSDIRLCAEMVDDGVSGVDFNRPAFLRMMEQIKAGEIDCVIVKDLSRFARNWIESGKYLEKFFPFMGVRFCSVLDNIDSNAVKNNSDNLVIPFKNLIHDAFLRDISVKIRSQLEVKRKRGDFIAPFAVYGYLKDPTNRNKLIIDEYVSVVVRDVFAWKMDGMSSQGIANKLNDLGVLSPMEYKKSLGFNFSTSFKSNSKALWSSVAIGRILTNEIYVGVLEQGKVSTPNYKVKRRTQKLKSEWIRVEDNHEAIISMETFQTVQSLMKNDVRISPFEDKVFLFSGLLLCADCKQNMVRKTVPSGKKKYIYYVCVANKNHNTCSSHSISENIIEKAIFTAIHKHIGSVVALDKMLRFMETLPMKKQDMQKITLQIENKQQETQKYNHRKIKLYEDLKDGIISQDEYNIFRDGYTKQLDAIALNLAKLQQEQADTLNNKTSKNLWIESFKAHENIETLTRSIVVSLIDRIYVYENGGIEIVFKYQCDFENAMRYVENIQDHNLIREGV